MTSKAAIALSAPDITEAEIEAVVGVLRSSRLSLGPKAREFEQAIARYVNVPYGVAISSGTAGLHMAIRALGIGQGDEVIVPSFAFIAVANAVRMERAKPVFADIDPITLNLDPSAVERAITPKTRAIIVVHTFGCPADLDEIISIAQRYKLRVIEDSCEAIGAEYRGRKTGGFGDAGVFAFYPNKQITTAEGAVLVTSDEDLASTFRMLRNQGRADDRDWLDVVTLGFNYRISELNCALGVEQMRRIESMLAARRRVAELYARTLKDVPAIVVPQLSYRDRVVSWFVFVVRLEDEFSRRDRDAVCRYMASRDVNCGRYFAPIHLQPAYADYAGMSKQLPVTEYVADRTIALPFYNRLDQCGVEKVCDCLKDAIRIVSGSHK